MAWRIVRNDITKMKTEAIVNTANANVTVGSGCDLAVYTAAGYEELLAYRREKIGIVPEGEVFLTPGFALPARYIIHAVSPLYKGGQEMEEEKLRSCYRKSLQLAKETGIRSIAFPLISTGSFGYPQEEGMRIAVDEISAFLLKNEMDIYLVVFSDRATALGGRLWPKLEEYIDRHYVEEKLREEYKGKFRERLGRHMIKEDAEAEERWRESLQAPSKAPSSPAPAKMPPAPEASKAPSAPAPRTSSVPAASGRSSASQMPHFDSIFKKKEAGTIKAANASFIDMEDTAEFARFGSRHEKRLEERIKHLSDTFSQYLLFLIQDKGMTNAEVYKRAIVDKKIFSKIKNNVDYHPQKRTAMCLCVGARLNLDETRDLLGRAGYALSPSDKTDVIFQYFIENEIYDMIELDVQLDEHGLPCMIE